jgi:hypothetical protein
MTMFITPCLMNFFQELKEAEVAKKENGGKSKHHHNRNGKNNKKRRVEE